MQSHPPAASPAAPAALVRNNRILIVDDNGSIHEDFRKILSIDAEEAELDAEEARLFGTVFHPSLRVPFALTFAFQGEEAARLVLEARDRGERFAMAFMDVRMPPGWDGMETTLKLWDIDPDLQVVMCTAYSDRSWEEMTRLLHFPERLLILKKPFDGIEVLQLAHSITEKWSLLQASRHNLEEMERLVGERTRELGTASARLQEEVASHEATGAALHRREQELADFFDNASVGLMQIGADGAILRINRAQAELFGCQLEDALGRHLSEFLADTEAVAGLLGRLLEGGTVKELETRLKGAGGAFKTVLMDANALMERGRFVHARCFTRDITERRRLESQVLHMQRLESIGTLAGGVAHDINNALSPIVLGLELLRAECPPARQGLLQSMQAGARRGTEIVRQILAFARGVEGDHAPVCLSHLIAEQTRICRTTFPKTIDVVSRVPEDLWMTVGDATQLHQILMNLCVNARDAMPGGGVLAIEAANAVFAEDSPCLHPAQKPGPHVRLTVSDTGTGMAPEVMQRMFDPFFSTKAAGKGTGLGLSTVLGIAQQHGGFLDVQSRIGAGSRFSVYLPAIPDAKAQEVAEEPSPPRGNHELILVVDDEPHVREIMQQTLLEHGYEVLTAVDGADAVAVFSLRKDDIDLVITDISMPVMDGPAAIMAIRRLNPATRIIAMSGVLDRGRLPLDRQGPEIVYLQKPFNGEKLLTRLRDALDAGRY